MKKILTLLLSLVMLLALSLQVAAVEIPDDDRMGSLTLQMTWEGEALEGGSLTLYRVGRITWKDDGYVFVPVEELEGAELSLDNLEDDELPGLLSELAKTHNLAPITQPIQGGMASFPSLQAGLYVVTQSQADACEGFEPINPFLISLPRWDGSAYVYDITAAPKVALEVKPTEPPATEPPVPTDPTLPQTGQMNWPVPVMVVFGLMLLITGWMLCFGKKERNKNE